MQQYAEVLDRRIFRLISVFLLLSLIVAYIGPGTAYADAAWYDSSWAFRKKITINSANVSATLADFPVLVNLSADGDLANNAQDDGDDILFTSSDGQTKISHEIEYFDGGTGELVAFVKVPSLSSSVDTELYLYYGNAGAGNQENATNVWDNNYKMVQHLEETSGGTNAILDSTSNTNHGTDNLTPTFQAAGKIGDAISFDGSDDGIIVADSPSLDITNNLTIEAWVKPTTAVTDQHRRILIKSHTSWGMPYYTYALWTELGLGFGISEGVDLVDSRSYSVNGTVSTSSWQHVVGTYDGAIQRWYIDGTQVATQASSLTMGTNSEPLYIGRTMGSATTFFIGTIDEIRLSDTARSADWILTSYNNQNSPATFYIVGSEDPGAPTAVGGTIYPVNKWLVLMPWLFLFSVLSLAVTRGILVLRRNRPTLAF